MIIAREGRWCAARRLPAWPARSSGTSSAPAGSAPRRATRSAGRIRASSSSRCSTPRTSASDDIVEAALTAHALPVELPDGPDAYRFADAEECRRTLPRAGFDADSVRVETVTAPWQTPTADLLFEAHLHAGLHEGTILRAQPPDRLAAIRAAMAEGVRRYADGDGFVLPIVARVVSAQSGGVF